VLVDEGGDGGCILDILAHTAFDRTSADQADHPQCLIAPLGEFQFDLLFLAHPVPTLPMIDPSPELGVIHHSQSPMFFIMQKIAMRTDRHIVDVYFIVTFFNCAFHSIIFPARFNFKFNQEHQMSQLWVF